MTHPANIIRTRAFSLVELLVVIGIITILAGILIPVALRASKSASATKLAADLQVIASALEAYRSDFGDYPRLAPVASRTAADQGSIVLNWALVGPYPEVETASSPGDGADGNGFRIRQGRQGKVYGPYIPADRFRSVTVTVSSREYKQLADGFNVPILYFPGKSGSRVGAGASNYIANSDTASFNPADNIVLPPAFFVDRLTKANFTGPFVLWSAGVDQLFGTKDDISNVTP